MFDPLQLGALWAPLSGTKSARLRRGLELATGREKVPTGLTPRELIWTRNKALLYHYLPPRQHSRRHQIPLLLIYALINKPYILDLYPGNSFIEYMLERGFDVYLLDWGGWGPEDRDVTLGDLVLEYVPKMVRQAARHAGQETVSIMGYCLGGLLAALYAALHPGAALRNVIFMAAPIDFASPGLIGTWLDRRHFPLDAVLAEYGNMPGELIEVGTKLLKPVTNFITPYVNLAHRLEDERSVHGWAAMHQWVNDGVDFPGAAFRQLVTDLYQQNLLIKGALTVNGRRVELARIHWPALLIAAQRDHITPLSTTIPLFDALANPDKAKLIIPAGHVGLVAGRGAVDGLWPRVSDWLARRSD